MRNLQHLPGILPSGRPTKTSEPIIGSLSVGHCPRCGLALRLAYTESGAHLEPDEMEGSD
ncbi:MAG TPA: hypothetical protein VGS80_15845 [Ktedonobacterales bacterium]|nr:hypothetical protein [Ktedonobacterales bacterium]